MLFQIRYGILPFTEMTGLIEVAIEKGRKTKNNGLSMRKSGFKSFLVIYISFVELGKPFYFSKFQFTHLLNDFQDYES